MDFNPCAPNAPKATPVAPKKAAMRMGLDTQEALTISLVAHKHAFSNLPSVWLLFYLTTFGGGGGAGTGGDPGLGSFWGLCLGGGGPSAPFPFRV